MPLKRMLMLASTILIILGQHANSLLADANKVPSSFRDTCKTQFLSESAVNILGCNYMLLEAQEQPPPDDIFHMWPFKCVTFDQLLVDIAKSITTAAVSHAASTSYFCANSEGSGSKAFIGLAQLLALILVKSLPQFHLLYMDSRMMRLVIHSFTKHALILLKTTTLLLMQMKLNCHPMMAKISTLSLIKAISILTPTPMSTLTLI